MNPFAFKILLATPLIIYTVVIGVLFYLQKHLIFHPVKLPSDHKYVFKDNNFSEGFFSTTSNQKLNYLHFKSEDPQNIIIYYRGNALALDQWGYLAERMVKATKSDVWIFDYPGFGKNHGDVAGSSSELLLSLIHI